MPFRNEHSARIKDPKGFDSFARKQIKPGISIVLGIKDGKSTAQAYRFDKNKFTVGEAKKWLKDNNISYILFEKAVQAFHSFVCLQIQAKIANLTDDEILKLIGETKLLAIKEKDPKPYFQAYSIAHEGESKPKILNEESKPIFWTRKAIQSIKEIVTRGIKFFFGHNEDNSTDNRRILGEVVADTQKEIDGKLHHIVIAYHPPEVREEVKKYDICSQEAEWDLEEEQNPFGKIIRFIADKIQKLTGIALGSSKQEKPAFEGARRLGMVQALEAGEPAREDKMTKEELMNSLTFHDLKQVVEKLNVFPTQLFSVDQLKADRNIKVFQELETITNRNKELEEKNKDLIQDNLKANAETRFKKMLSEEGFQVTENQKSFLESFTIKDFEGLTDEELRAFRNKELDRFKRYNASIGDSANVEINTNTQASSATDYTKAENNPLLEEDYDL